MSATMHALRARFDPTVTSWPGAVHKTLFGHPGYSVGGRVFAFFDDGQVIVRVPAAERDRLLATPGAFIWRSPGSGPNGSSNWVALIEGDVNDDLLGDALEAAYRYLARRAD